MEREKQTALVPVEVLPPEPIPPTTPEGVLEQMEQIVQQKVAEVMAQKDGFGMEPWFRPAAVAREIKRLQSVPEQKKFAVVFERFGCFCILHKGDRHNRPHAGNGFCDRCRPKFQAVLNNAVREGLGEKELPQPRRCDDCDLDFSPMTDRQWGRVRQQHESSRRHTKEPPTPRFCAVCKREFPPMTDRLWESVRPRHESSKPHRQALTARRSR